MGIPAPKPANWDELVQTWNDPQAFAIARAKYYSQLRAEHIDDYSDITEPRRSKEDMTND